MKKIIVVADDAGFASTDRGIRELVDKTGVPVCAEYMIGQPGAIELAQRMQRNSLVSLGLHFELSELGDAERYRYGKLLQSRCLFLGEQPEIRAMGERDARHQLRVFQNEVGQPAHISTHGNFNADYAQRVMPWWNDLMNELFDGDVPPMQLGIPHVRHNLYSWTTAEHHRPPLSPVEFGEMLQLREENNTLEFVVHPARPKAEDPSINMLFNELDRVHDLEFAIDIIRSGVIGKAGYAIVPVSAIKKEGASIEGVGSLTGQSVAC